MVIGTTYPIPFKVTNPVTGAATDIANWQYEAIIEDSLDGSDDDQVLTKSHTVVADGGNNDPANGLAELRIESTENAGLTAGDKFMKIRRTIPNTSPADVRLIGPFPIKIKSGN